MDIRSLKNNYFDSMNRAKKGYNQMMEPICRRWNLTRNELDIILFLANNPEYDRASDIVIHRGMAKSHVSLSAGTLEEKGMLNRRGDETDHRAVRLQLTEEAKEVAELGREAQTEFFRKIYAGLTREEIEVWVAISRKVSANIAALGE